MRRAYLVVTAVVALPLLAAPAHADDCEIDSCAISCEHGCAAAIVDGECVKGCSDDAGNLDDQFWQDVDNATKKAKKAGRKAEQSLCFKSVKNTRGRSGSHCK